MDESTIRVGGCRARTGRGAAGAVTSAGARADPFVLLNKIFLHSFPPEKKHTVLVVIVFPFLAHFLDLVKMVLGLVKLGLV
jgi:hypothetical protein